MRRFVINIAIFGLLLLVVLLVEDALTTCAFHHKATRKYVVWNEMIHTDIDADLLIMGNSRAMGQYSPQIFDSVFGINSYNLGIDGGSFDRQLARYDVYRHYQQRAPGYIIQNIEFATLGHTVGYEREQFMPYLMYPYFRKRIREAEPFSLGELYIPMYRYYISYFYNDYFKFDFHVVKGYLGEDRVWDGKKLNETEPFTQEVDPNTLRLFVNYIEKVQQEGIKLVLVIAPLYKDGKGKVLNFDEIHGIYYDLSEKYDIPLLDYTDCWLSQDTVFFYNATHLNKTGAELFTRRLCHDLDSLGVFQN